MPQLTSMPAHVLSCVPVAPPTSELSDPLRRRVLMLTIIEANGSEVLVLFSSFGGHLLFAFLQNSLQ